MASAQEMVNDIDAHIKKSGISFGGWYVGISADGKDRLFNGHSVPQTNHWWIVRAADTSTIARAVEQHFLDLGCKGGPGGGDNTARDVYAYVITGVTRE